MEPSNHPGQAIPGAFSPQAGEVTLAVREHAFLSGLDEAQFATLAKIAQPVEFREHELILAAKQRSSDFYLLLSGSISIELDTRLYTVRIQSLRAGDAFGWSALLEDRDSLFDVRSRDRSTALRLNGARLSAALGEDPVFAAELLKRTLHLAAVRVHATEMCLGEFCGVRMRTTERKVADATTHALNKLIEVCLDGELGYRTAAEHLHSSNLAAIFSDYSTQRAQYAKELRAKVERFGGIPTHPGSVAASLHRGWIALKPAISGGDAKAIIAACEAGEDAALASYEAAMKSDLMLSEIRSMVEAQWRAIDQSHRWLQEVHQELASGIQ